MPLNEYTYLKQTHNSETGINEDDLYQIYVGFIVDGVETYTNYSIIYVFYDPVIDYFPGSDRVRVFQTYKGEQYIEIYVSLRPLSFVEDYSNA